MKKTMVLTAALLLGGCAAGSGQKGGEAGVSPASAEEARMLITQAQATGNPESLIYAYRQALEFRDFDKGELYLSMAALERQRSNNGAAEQAYRDALQLDPDNRSAREALGLLLIEMKRHQEAESLLLEVVAADQAKLGQTSTETVECVTNAESPWRSYNGLGLLADMLEQGQHARAYYRCALKIQPGMAMLHTNLGFSHYLESDYPQAEEAYTRAVNQEPNYKRAWSNLGLLYYRWGRSSEALMALRKVMTQAEALNDLGYIAMMEGEHDTAASLFQRAIDASPRYYPKAVENLNRVKTMSAVGKR